MDTTTAIAPLTTSPESVTGTRVWLVMASGAPIVCDDHMPDHFLDLPRQDVTDTPRGMFFDLFSRTPDCETCAWGREF